MFHLHLVSAQLHWFFQIVQSNNRFVFQHHLVVQQLQEQLHANVYEHFVQLVQTIVDSLNQSSLLYI